MFSSIPSSSDVLDPDPSSSQAPPPQSETIPHLGISSSDLDLPIAVNKRPRFCVTHHPIQTFVSYRSLSHVFHAFVSNLANECILKHVSKALSHPKWEETMVEEMNALEKNHTGAYYSSTRETHYWVQMGLYP